MQTRRTRGRPPAAADGFERRIAHYEDDEGVALLAELARLRGGLSVTGLLRMLTREEAARRGVKAAGGDDA